MSQSRENKFIFWKTLSKMLINKEFKYINSIKYNVEISLISNEVYELLAKTDIRLDSYFNEYNEQRKTFIFTNLENILFNDDFAETLPLSSPKNKVIIENTLNTISVELESSLKPLDRKAKIHLTHNITYTKILSKDIRIWVDYKNSNLFFRVQEFGDKKRINKADFTDYLYNLGMNIEIYNNIKDVKNIDSSYLIISLLPIVKMEIFNPYNNLEFIPILNNMFYKNTFQYTKHLNRRIEEKKSSNKESIIFEFIRNLSRNGEQFLYIIHWLSFYFKSLIKSSDVLVLIGDKTITENILINQIIKPLFAKKEKYFASINDQVLTDEPLDNVFREKIFYHIGDVTKNRNIKKANEIIKNILAYQSQNNFEILEEEKCYSFGQLIVTAEKENPYPFLTDIYGRCVVFGVNKLDKILNQLGIDEPALMEAISNDLDNFANKLLEQDILKDINLYRDTKEKQLLHEGRFSEINNTDIPEHIIADFIDCIKNHKYNRNRFKVIEREDPILYAELIYNFEENMIARQLLATYFNIMFPLGASTTNEDLLNRLKKDIFFRQDINKNKQYKRKKRYLLPEQVDKTKRKPIYKNKIKKLQKTKNTL